MKILMVIENSTNLEQLVSRCESDFKAEVVFCDAVSKIAGLTENNSFDLALVDAAISKGDGMDVLKSLRNLHSQLALPVVIISTLRDTGTTVRLLEAGANDVLYLPLDMPLSMARLANVIRIRDLHLTKTLAVHHSPQFNHEPSLGYIDEAERTAVFHTFDSKIPCEIPVLALFKETQHFCKTVEIGLKSLTLLSFGHLPEERRFLIQMSLGDEEPKFLKVTTKNRRDVDEWQEGTVELELGLIEGQDWYNAWFLKMNHAYQIGGKEGLQGALRNAANAFMKGADKAGAKVPGWFNPMHRNLPKANGNHRYQFQKLLGRGGFASVFLAKDLTLKRWVAMKVLDTKMVEQEKSRNNFLNEAQIVAQLQHPNLVTIFEVGELSPQEAKSYFGFPREVLDRYPSGIIYFTMQYIEGESLGKRLKKKKAMPQSEVLRILIEICKGLAYAHEKGVIHRDIKPHNVMLNNDDVILTDFGLADIVEEGGDLFQEFARTDEGKRLSCTPIYAPPEQLRGKKGHVGSDIYSLAVMGYEMFTGRNPFAAPELNGILKKKVRDLPPSLGEKVADLHPGLVKVIDKSMSVNPKDRYESASQVLQALLEVQLEQENQSSPKDVEQQLWDLLNMAIFAEDVYQAGEALTKLNALVCLHQNSENSPIIEKLRKGIADPDLLNSLIEKNLNNANQDILFQVLKNLESSRSVYILLQWFQRERQQWKKDFFARLAVICSRENLMPLIAFGRELPDGEAVLVLRGFRQLEADKLYPALFEWSLHEGRRVQKEWLSIYNNLRQPPTALTSVVKAWREGTGTNHSDVARYAAEIDKKLVTDSNQY